MCDIVTQCAIIILSLPLSFAVVTQYYEAEVVSEYVIRGNAAILKCTIPSFVAEFVSVESWVGSDGSTFKSSTDYGIALCFRPLYLLSYPLREKFLLKRNMPERERFYASLLFYLYSDSS